MGNINMGTRVAKTFRKRTDLHLARKFWHFLGVFTIIIIYHNMPHNDALKIMGLITFGTLTSEILRLNFRPINKFVKRYFHPLMRDTERNAFTGVTALFIGTFIIIAIFPRDIVRISLYFLAAADPIASYFGIRYGKDKLLQNKSLQGTMAAFVVCTIISVLFFATHNLMSDRLIISSLLAGLIGATSELVSVGKLDDNFTIPVVSATFLWLMFYVFGAL